MIWRVSGGEATQSVDSHPILERAATLLATGFGSGYSPIAPGTAGSLVGLALYWPLVRLPAAAQLAALTVLSALGVWAATGLARRIGQEDPSVVVVDEIAGMWVALLFLPFTAFTAVAAFLLFRVMDVIKPFPAGRLERLPGGLGIVADDLMAGIYANLAVRLLLAAWPA